MENPPKQLSISKSVANEKQSRLRQSGTWEQSGDLWNMMGRVFAPLLSATLREWKVKRCQRGVAAEILFHGRAYITSGQTGGRTEQGRMGRRYFLSTLRCTHRHAGTHSPGNGKGMRQPRLGYKRRNNSGKKESFLSRFFLQRLHFISKCKPTWKAAIDIHGNSRNARETFRCGTSNRKDSKQKGEPKPCAWRNAR